MTERPSKKNISPRFSPRETTDRVTEKATDKEPGVRDAEKNLETNRIPTRHEESRYETEISGRAPV